MRRRFVYGLSLFVYVLVTTSAASAAKRVVVLRDVGLLTFVKHDLFHWDAEMERARENGQLDLSSLFDQGFWQSWNTGGLKENTAHPIVANFTFELIDYFRAEKKRLEKVYIKTQFWGSGPRAFKEARQATIRYYLDEIDKTLKRVFGFSLPQEADLRRLTNTEQAYLRLANELLPGTIFVSRLLLPDEISILDPWQQKIRLYPEEYLVSIRNFNGKYNEAFEDNLRNEDEDFFSSHTGLDFEETLKRLKDQKQEALVPPYKSLFKKALCIQTPKWNVREVPCN